MLNIPEPRRCVSSVFACSFRDYGRHTAGRVASSSEHWLRHSLKHLQLVLDDPSEAIQQGVRGLFRRSRLSILTKSQLSPRADGGLINEIESFTHQS